MVGKGRAAESGRLAPNHASSARLAQIATKWPPSDFGPGGVFYFGCSEEQSGREPFGSGIEGGGQALGFWRSSLGQVFAATAASAQLGHGFLQQRAHVVGLTGGLGEDQRGLWRFGGEQGDRGGRLVREFLGQKLEEVQVAVGEGAHH